MQERILTIQSEIAGYKQILTQTDYKAIKYAEGQLSVEEYAPVKASRQELRDKINELEEEQTALSESEEQTDAE